MLKKKHFKSGIIIASFNIHEIQNFLKKCKIIGDINKKNLIFKKLKIISKKNTILKSPHVNKKARDQIQIKSFFYFLKFNKTFNIRFFILLLNKSNNFFLNIDLLNNYLQKNFLILYKIKI